MTGGFLAALAWISTLSWEEPSWHTWREAFQLQLLWDRALKPLQDLELQQQKRSGLNKKLWDQGSSAMSNNLCGAFYLVFSDLSRFWRGSDSDLHKDFCSGPDRIIWPKINWALSPCEWQEPLWRLWQELVGQTWRELWEALGDSIFRNMIGWLDGT